MADPTPVSPVRASEESATTREEMDFEDEHEQETGTVSPLGHETPTQPTATSPPAVRKSVSFQEPQQEEAPPAKPPRPLSPQQQAENTLIEAFPSVDTKVVKAVLVASGGQIEPAFNALLGMSDPDFRPEEPAAPPQPPARPPRPAPQQRAPMSQLEADELYARQLAEQYNSNSNLGAAPRAQNRYNQREPARRSPNQQPRPAYGYEEEQERNFFDDDLPEIGKNIQQGFLDTQKKVSSWITNFKKRIDGEASDDEDDLYSGAGGSRQNEQTIVGGRLGRRQDFGPSQSDQLRGIQKMGESQQMQQAAARRRSTEATRYDADPHELGEEEFERLELRDDEVDAQDSNPPPMPPRTSSRQAPNPNLFTSKSSTGGVKAPQSGPVDEVEAAGEQPTDPKAKKWQPLTSVAPHPDDEDPFSLGDDEEGEKGDDLRKVDTQRLKDAARNSISAEGAPSKELQEAGKSGSQNQEALELLGGAEKKE